MTDGREAEDADAPTRALAEQATRLRFVEDRDEFEPPLELLRAVEGVVVELSVPQLVDDDAKRCREAEEPDGEEFVGRASVAEHGDRGARDRRDERQELETDVGQRPKQVRRLHVVGVQLFAQVTHPNPPLSRRRRSVAPNVLPSGEPGKRHRAGAGWGAQPGT